MAEKKAFLLRISQPLWEELQRLAEEEFRSVNGQVEFLLRESLRKRGRQVRAQPEQGSDDKIE